jgi:hypothetical protein
MAKQRKRDGFSDPAQMAKNVFDSSIISQRAENMTVDDDEIMLRLIRMRLTRTKVVVTTIKLSRS